MRLGGAGRDQMKRIHLPVQETHLGQEGPLEKEMATHSSILAWKIPWTEEHLAGYSPWQTTVVWESRYELIFLGKV